MNDLHTINVMLKDNISPQSNISVISTSDTIYIRTFLNMASRQCFYSDGLYEDIDGNNLSLKLRTHGFPICYVLGKVMGLGSQGIWIGLLAGLTVSAVLLYWRFNYLTNKLIETK